MPRDTFPREDDRAVITGFLAGTKRHGDTSGALDIHVGSLRIHENTVAYYDTAGALVGIFLNESWGSVYAMHVANEMLTQLGALDTRVTREVEPLVPPDGGSPNTRWFIGDELITPGVPFVICGPLGIAAWRASRGIKTRRVK